MFKVKRRAPWVSGQDLGPGTSSFTVPQTSLFGLWETLGSWLAGLRVTPFLFAELRAKLRHCRWNRPTTALAAGAG